MAYRFDRRNKTCNIILKPKHNLKGCPQAKIFGTNKIMRDEKIDQKVSVFDPVIE